jgi:benzoyl-CoA reductase/2-hydroxyglutaryl-CoA dehydratase subunit BcrC/BadD/HgdB
MQKRTFIQIRDSGDESVGIFPQTWFIECPFTLEDISDSDAVEFANSVHAMYQDFCEGKMRVSYVETDLTDIKQVIQIRDVNARLNDRIEEMAETIAELEAEVKRLSKPVLIYGEPLKIKDV